MLHFFKADINGQVSVTVFAVELLNVSTLVMTYSVFDYVGRIAVYAVLNIDDRFNPSCLDFLSNGKG
jgi:hypothetical protein